MSDTGSKTNEVPVSDLPVEVTTDDDVLQPSDSRKEIKPTGSSEVVTEVIEETITEEEENVEDFEEIEEEYEEEIEENGEVKNVTKKRTVRVKKNVEPPTKDGSLIEEEVEEEFEEEEVDENGEVKIVTKKRLVKLIKTAPVKEKSEDNFIEVEEQYEEEVVDEGGEMTIVKKTRLVKIPKEEKLLEQVEEDFEELEEEFEEKELDENGDTVTVIKKRLVKVPIKKVKETEVGEDSGEIVKIPSPAELTTEEGHEELEAEDIEEEELAEEEEEEDEEGEGERRKVRKKIETSGSEEEEEKVKVRRRKRKAPKKKKKESVISIEIEEVSDEEEVGDRSVESLVVSAGKEIESESLSSAELLAAEERAAIIEHFETLTRLRIEHMNLRKKNFFLNNKLVQYFKKQKMDHMFMETKEDSDVEQRYSKKLTQFFETNQEMMEEKLRINSEWESQRSVNEELSEEVKQGSEALFAQKRELASKLIDSRTGRTILHDKAIEDLLTREENILKQISECRLAQIKLRWRIEAKKRERQMEHMGRDFNLMDYEKLASLKEYYMDKITQRDIEVDEVMHKLRSMNDSLSMVKWNLSQKEEEHEKQQRRLWEVSQDLDMKRASLNKIKATRHKTEKNTAKVKQQSGLLAYPMLLKDYEEKSQRMKELQDQVDAFKGESREAVIRIRRLREIVRKKTLQKNMSNRSSTLFTTSYQS